MNQSDKEPPKPRKPPKDVDSVAQILFLNVIFRFLAVGTILGFFCGLFVAGLLGALIGVFIGGLATRQQIRRLVSLVRNVKSLQ